MESVLQNCSKNKENFIKIKKQKNQFLGSNVTFKKNNFNILRQKQTQNKLKFQNCIKTKIFPHAGFEPWTPQKQNLNIIPLNQTII